MWESKAKKFALECIERNSESIALLCDKRFNSSMVQARSSCSKRFLLFGNFKIQTTARCTCKDLCASA